MRWASLSTDKESFRHLFADGIRHRRDALTLQSKGSSPRAEAAKAAISANLGIEADGLLPGMNEHGELLYSAEQGRKAAVHGREDIAATLHLQLAILRRLDHVKFLIIFAIAILAYIAVKI